MSDPFTTDFMRDQLEALLASPALTRVAERRDEQDEVRTSEAAHDEAPIDRRDTEPSIDVQVLRDALSRGLK